MYPIHISAKCQSLYRRIIMRMYMQGYTCNVTCLYKMWFTYTHTHTHIHTFAYNTRRKGPANTKGGSDRISVNEADVTLFKIVYTYNSRVYHVRRGIQGDSPSVLTLVFRFIYWNLFRFWFLEFSEFLNILALYVLLRPQFQFHKIRLYYWESAAVFCDGGIRCSNVCFSKNEKPLFIL